MKKRSEKGSLYQLLDKSSQVVKRILSSKHLYIAILTVFFLQVSWLALNAKSLPYDEYYHYGVTEIYSRQWSPFIHHQDIESSLYGELTRAPSYLYHYLMSFPMRFAKIFTDSSVAITIFLRFINIAMVIASVLLFRRLLLRAKMSTAVINVSTAFFLFTPLTPVLAAHINYDNLIMLIAPLQILYAYKMYTKEQLSYSDLAVFTTLGMFGSLVKFLYIPLVGILLIPAIYKFITKKTKLKNNLSQYSKPVLLGCGVIFSILLILFVERFGGNLVRYGSLDVKCEKVHARSFCYNNTVWRRDADTLKGKAGPAEQSASEYFARRWTPTMIGNMSSVYTNIPQDVPIEDNPYGTYTARARIPPFPRISTALVIVSLAILLVSVLLKMLSDFDRLVILTFALYAAMVFANNYLIYIKYGQAYAIQPRYLVFLWLPLMAVIASLASKLLRRRNSQRLSTVMPIAVFTILAIYCVSGGLTGWIIRADKDWFWDGRPLPHRYTLLSVEQ